MKRTPPIFTIIAVVLAASAPAAAEPAGDRVTANADSVVRYIESCRKPNGAFGPLDQEYTDAAWNYPAVTALQALKADIAKPENILEHGLGAPVGHAGFGHLQFYHVHALRSALSRPIKPQHPRVNVVHSGFKIEYYSSPFGAAKENVFKTGGRPNPDPIDVEADTFYYHNVSSLFYLLYGLAASDRQPLEKQPLIDYIRRRQAANGGFADSHADAGAGDFDAHIVHTMQAVLSLASLGVDAPEPKQVAAFVRSCRDKKTGGYRWNPRLSLPGNDVDVYYTWAAALTLLALDEEPEELATTLTWLNSLQNADGGFGDRPGWRSRLYSTCYAIEALELLGGELQKAITTKQLPVTKTSLIADGAYDVFQAQFKMPVVSVAELDALDKRGFNLLALKSDRVEDAQPLLDAIRERGLPMDVVLCSEEYPHRLTQIGGATLNHVGNYVLDPRWTREQWGVWREADTAGGEFSPWATYRDKVVRPVTALGSFAYPEQDYEQEYAYIAYGSDTTGERGYNAVLAGFNWPPKDFVRVFPWRERYVDRLTPIADVDAHGNYEKWSPQLDTTRTLFLAKRPTYADFQDAARNGRVVTVIAQPEGVPSGASYYGPQPAVDYVRRRVKDWKWW
jgi:prenyltransferase beta subunit